MKTNGFKGVLSFVVAVAVTAAMAYSAVTVVEKNNAAKEKAAKEAQAIGSEVSTEGLKDGEYEGTATGYGGPLTVRITVKGGKLTDIKVVSQTETPEYFNRAKAVIGRILSSGNVNVDSVSGATISSNAIKKAVADALSKAGSKQQAKVTPVKKDARSAKGRKGNAAGTFSIGSANLNDGVYTGSGQGYNGPIRVRVTVSGGNITNVEILSNSDDAPFFNRAKAVIGRLLGSPGKSVDTVSGATYSSRGIIDAVRNALSSAGKTTVTNTSSTNTPAAPDNKPSEDNVSPAVNPETGDPAYVDAALRKHYPGDKLKDGDYTGIGIGYLNPGGIKTYITVKDGEISSLRVGVGDDYRDDMGPFRSQAENVIPFLQGKDGRWNIAKLGLYREYFEAIRKSADHKAKVKELLGDKYVGMLNGLSGNNTVSDLTLMSRAVKAYMNDRYEGKKMFDSVSGATISASGISAATKEASNKSANDYMTNSGIKEISIVSPKSKAVEVNTGSPVDFSNLKVKVVKRDGTESEVAWNDFEANGLSITDEDGNAIENGSDLKAYGDKKVIKAKVIHKQSLSYDNFRILVGRYSKDYIVGLEYSKDGTKWYKADTLNKDSIDSNKIDDQQVIEAPTSFEFENVKVRLVSKEGHRYEYTADQTPVSKKVRYTVVKDENPNAPQALFVTFKLSGTEADKQLVENNSGNTENPVTPGTTEPTENLPEVSVDSKVIETVLDEPGRPKWTQGVPIKPATVTSLDKDAEMVASIEGLPKGLSFDGTTITGTPVVDDDNWDGDDGMFKTVTMKFKAKKNGKLLVREYKYWIYRDKDHDGIADDDEDGGTAFTPQRVNAKPVDVDGKAPTLEDYKAKFSNIPADGSVKVKLVQKPDLSKKGMTKAVLEFSVDGIDKKSKAIVMVNVKTPAADAEETIPEVKVDSKVIETVLDEPGRPKWTQGVPIKPATVTSLDKDAEMVASIEGLPKGLSFDGTTITGTPVVDDDNWDGDDGMFKTVTMKFKAKKNGKLLVREYKYWIYRDKDHDGIADDDEDGGTAFTPQRVNAKPIDVDGTEPTLEDYKAKFSNIPADGSVKVKLIQKPDLSKKGMTKAVLEFSVDGIDKKTKTPVMVNVKTPVANAATSAVTSGTTSTRSAVTAAISGNSSVETRDSGKANKREDIQKPAESKVVAENSAAAETERTVS
ncbi:FMN-binding protein [Mogibacterium diversum]|uniref:FMN-binding protein n=1 Tax=Mogibacterium diversum TaxID=114527 RepID=UPI0028F070D1|nr:FMN-binding protein [Mogibacterium diversum]